MFWVLNEYHENTKVIKHEILIGVFRGFVLSCFRDKISFLLNDPLFMINARRLGRGLDSDFGDFLPQYGHHLEQVSHDAIIGHIENGGLRIFIDRQDHF